MGYYKTGKHLKEFKKDFKTRYDLSHVDHNWKKRWLPFIKYDHDWDGLYILFLLLAKLHIMYDFYITPGNCLQEEEGLQKKIAEIKEAIDFGEAFYEKDNYNTYLDEAMNFMQEHCLPVEKEVSTPDVRIYQGTAREWDSKESEKTFDKLVQKANKERKKDLKHFFNLVSDGIDNWWD